jgi:protein-disulfide isomerase
MRVLLGVASGVVLVLFGACSSAAQPAAAPPLAPSDVVATVAGVNITLTELDRRALQAPAESFSGLTLVQALYEARSSALTDMVFRMLVEREAAALGVTPETLVEREVLGKAPAPSDAEVGTWYQANPGRVGGATLEQVREPIRNLLMQQRQIAARDAYLEVLKARTPVTMALPPPRVSVDAAGRPVRGPATAPVEIIEFSDFECPFCLKSVPIVAQVLKTYGDRVKLVYRHYPLPNHPNARPAAEASLCANEQGKFWEYHDRLFANASRLTGTDLKEHAAAIGLNAAAFSACVDAHKYRADVDADIKAANEAGVTGTPAFFINGRLLGGAQPFEAFQAIIDDELARQGR